MSMIRWHTYKAFCSWLADMRYGRIVKGKLTPYMTEGQVVYMFEAFKAGETSGTVGAECLLASIAQEIEKREAMRQACGDHRLAPSSAGDVAAVIRSILPSRDE